MDRALDLYCTFLKFVIAALLACMVVLVFSNVVLRYVWNSGIGATDELSRWMLVWMTFLGAIVGLRQRQHLGVTSFLAVLPPLLRRLTVVVSYGLMLWATYLLVLGSWKQTLINWTVAASGTGLSTGFFYGIGVVFGASAAIILLYDLLLIVTGRMTDAELLGISVGETA